MRRKSCCKVRRATSAIAPAISTPVGAAADNDEGEEAPPLGLVLDHLGAFEGEQEPPPDLGRIADVLEPGREWRPIVMAEIGVGRSGGEHQIVVGKIDLACVHTARLHVDAGDPRHDHPDVLLLRAGWRESARRHRPATAPRSRPDRAAAGSSDGCGRRPASPRRRPGQAPCSLRARRTRRRRSPPAAAAVCSACPLPPSRYRVAAETSRDSPRRRRDAGSGLCRRVATAAYDFAGRP